MAVYNYLGQPVTLADLRFKSPEYGEVLPNGKVVVHWEEENEYVDDEGFDKFYVGNSGHIDIISLPKGTKLARYGGPEGSVTTLAGTPYESLGMPYVKETIQYHEYIVEKEIFCVVKRGKAARMFDSPGGGIQFKHFCTIKKEVLNYKNLREDFTWLEKRRSSES